ncbi:MAG TPA: AAA family ATPase [Bacteroidia bacterium]
MMKQSKALAILKSGKNVFLTGSAGAGKTYVLNRYIEYLKELKIPVAITASTGIAATHMNGMTIHAWSGIGVKDALGPKDLQFLKAKKYLNDKLEEVEVLIIDEISMLHKQQLDMVDMVLRFFKKNDLAFGGIQVVFSGDFFQLPPIGRPGEENKEKFSFMSKAWLDASPVICYISEQFRQSDNELNRILNVIRDGKADQSTMDALTKVSGRVQDRKLLTRLYTHNTDVDRVNFEHLTRIQAESKVFTAVVKGNDKLRDLLRKSVLTDEILELRIGTKVMFIKNNFEKGYMNGTLGEVVEFTENGFPNVKTADKLIEAEPEDWTIQDEHGKTLASFNQVPLRLAWAITVHKSQGMTLDAAEIDLSKTFENGQGYVALSRLKDMDGLYLTGFNSRALSVDPLALRADRRFRELSTEADAKWTEEELEKYAKAFELACSRLNTESKKIKKKSKTKVEKKTTYELTEELVLQGMNIKEIAKERGITESVIVGHLEKLKEIKPELDLQLYQPDPFVMADIQAAIATHGDDLKNEKGNVSLGKLYASMGQKYDYTTIKLGLIFIKEA